MPYLTVEEMRQRKFKDEKPSPEGGTRFIGTTEPRLAFKYFRKDWRILECGPHFGKFSKLLTDNGYQNIHLLDFLDELTFIERNSFPFQEIDFNKDRIPYADGFFEGVTAWGIVEHMENPFHFTREVHRVLKPGGIYLMALPNVFHIMSRLLFLKKGMFPRWDKNNNHIFVLPRGVFEKTILRYFELVETVYTKSGIQYPGLNKLARFLPANEWFGNYITYVLRKK